MNDVQSLKLSGVAVPHSAAEMLDEICEHFIEHAEVERSGDRAVLRSKSGIATIRTDDGKLLIALECSTQALLEAARTDMAEHLFYFAGDQPLELTWMTPTSLLSLPNLHEVTVISVENVTPKMRRVVFSCADVTPFMGGDMHVRLLVPPKGRAPVWPGFRQDGRISWPEGDDQILVRVYTIRSVDLERGEVSIDFLQHPMHGISTPGADFARDARAGDKAALLGPGGGDLPTAKSMLLIGDESALPAIARIAAEVPVGTQMQALIEVEDEAEEQSIVSGGVLDVRWLHRSDYPDRTNSVFLAEAQKAIASIDPETFVWAACEKADIRALRSTLKERRHDRKKMYVAWYWERNMR
ncbi:phage tail protein [Rhizobium sp. 58]|nr:phage tail protein [Rhizobium sp. 58]